MAGRPKRRGRFVTPAMAERLAREGKLHGRHYSEAFLALLQGRDPQSAHDPYAVHLMEARIAGQRAGEAVERSKPLIWQEIREIDALSRRHGNGNTRAFQSDLADLERRQATRRAANPAAYASEMAQTRRRKRRNSY